MNPLAILTVGISLSLVGASGVIAFQQLGGWSPEQHQQIPTQQQAPTQFGASINPFAASLQQATAQPAVPQFAPQFAPHSGVDLQNQVQALGAQLAAANRQIQFYQQQLSLASGQQQPQQAQQLGQAQPTIQSQPVNQPLSFQSQQQEQLQAQLQQQQQLQAALAAQQQQLAAQQQQQFQQAPQSPQQAQFAQQLDNQQLFQQQPQPAPVSTLADNQQATSQLTNDPRLAGQPQFFAQQQQQQHHQQQQQLQQQLQAQAQAQLESSRLQQQQQQQQLAPTTSSSVEPSIEPSSAVQQPTAATASQPAQQVPTSHAPVHSAPKDDDKFSIGLGVLSPGYTQKFGNTALDFNQDKNGYSFTLSNNGHSNQVPPQPTQRPAASSE